MSFLDVCMYVYIKFRVISSKCVYVLNLIDSRNCTYFERKCRAISKKVHVMPKGLMQTYTLHT